MRLPRKLKKKVKKRLFYINLLEKIKQAMFEAGVRASKIRIELEESLK